MTNFGKYELIKPISSGGMAEIFLACHTAAGGFRKEVAIKRVHPHLSKDAEFAEMFLNEARISAQLSHQNIVQIYDFGEQDGQYYLTMEYVPGIDVKTLFVTCAKKELLLPLPLTVYLIQEACKGLDYAHRKADPNGTLLGLVHRDVSPRNILVSHEGEVKIVDFGIAKATNVSAMTQGDTLKGNVPYMSPEQITGSSLDRRSDLFSLSVIFWELLTNKRLFQAEDQMKTLWTILNGELPELLSLVPNLPKTLVAIVQKGLARDREKRYQSGEEMFQDLEEFARLNQFSNQAKSLAGFIQNYVVRDKPVTDEERLATNRLQNWKELARLTGIPVSDRTVTLSGAQAPPKMQQPAPARAVAPGSATALVPAPAAPAAPGRVAAPAVAAPPSASAPPLKAAPGRGAGDEWDLVGRSLDEPRDPKAAPLLAPDAQIDYAVRQALHDVREYLVDRIPPIQVAESIQLLVAQPPEVLAAEIHSWSSYQMQSPEPGMRIADYLFYSVEKTFSMGELRLMSKRTLGRYLIELMKLMLSLCPPTQRAALKQNLLKLGQSMQAMNSVLDYLRSRKALGGVGCLSGNTPEGMRRLAVMAQRIEALSQMPEGEGVKRERQELLSHVLQTAAGECRNLQEFESYLEVLRQNGVEVSSEDVFKVLSQDVPGWASGGEDAPGVSDSMLRTMERLISLAQDPTEIAQQLRQVVRAVIEQFNQGNLASAVKILATARQMLDPGRLEPNTIQRLRKAGDGNLEQEKLRLYADQPELHPQLRQVLSFFVAYEPMALLKELQNEDKPDRRKLLIDLLYIHGPSARTEVNTLLKAASGDSSTRLPDLFVKDCLQLWCRLPRPEFSPVEEEIQMLVHFLGSRYPAHVVREALVALGQLKHPTADLELIKTLKSLEKKLLVPEQEQKLQDELHSLCDRTCSALFAQGSERAVRALIDHGLQMDPRLGDAAMRLVCLEGMNLSIYPALLDQMVKGLRKRLPFQLFGILFKTPHKSVQSLVQGLSSSPHQEVRKLFQSIVDSYEKQPFAQVAAKALQNFQSTTTQKRVPQSFRKVGQLTAFDLLSLLESVVQRGLTGELNLQNAQGESLSTFLFEEGRLRWCQSGSLKGGEALYQLFERPVQGQFVLRERRLTAAELEAADPALELEPLILEGVRRHDELKLACAVVPDYGRFRATGVKPSSPAEEKSTQFMKELWKKATSGLAARKCEEGSAVDAYRVRKLLAYWVEEGALELILLAPSES